MSPLMKPEEYEGWVTAAEKRTAEGFGSPRRRAEYLTWRALVRQYYGHNLQFAYDALGAPYVVNHPEWYLSVSHTKTSVAVLLSEYRCGIDMEETNRRFQRIRHKYLTDEELALSDHPHFLAIAWCAKEALYKYAGERELDFTQDLRLLGFDAGRAEGQLRAQIKDGEPLWLTVDVESDYVIVEVVDGR